MVNRCGTGPGSTGVSSSADVTQLNAARVHNCVQLVRAAGQSESLPLSICMARLAHDVQIKAAGSLSLASKQVIASAAEEMGAILSDQLSSTLKIAITRQMSSGEYPTEAQVIAIVHQAFQWVNTVFPPTSQTDHPTWRHVQSGIATFCRWLNQTSRKRFDWSAADRSAVGKSASSSRSPQL